MTPSHYLAAGVLAGLFLALLLVACMARAVAALLDVRPWAAAGWTAAIGFILTVWVLATVFGPTWLHLN